MSFVDSHCHIQSIGSSGDDNTNKLWDKLDASPEQVIERSLKAMVTKLICVGCDLADSLLALQFVSQKEHTFASIGIHPHEASKFVSDNSAKIAFSSIFKDNPKAKIVAIGECGLDYYYKHSTADDQLEILRFQLDLAVEHNLPVIFHVREAFNAFWPLFDSYGGQIRGVLHSFTDNELNLQRALKSGLFIGVNGIATFAKEKNQIEMYKSIPLSSLLLETDSPYLTPAPYRGNINEPKYIVTIAEFLAKLRQESLEQLEKQTSQNARLLFGI